MELKNIDSDYRKNAYIDPILIQKKIKQPGW